MSLAETKEDHGLANALAWFQSIKEMVEALEKANLDAMSNMPTPDGNWDAANDEIRERIQESVLSVEVRSGWETVEGYFAGQRRSQAHLVRGFASPPGSIVPAPAEYRILLTTGGPACQLVGELDEHGEPESARLKHQDWGTPWTEVSLLAFSTNPIEDQIKELERKREILLTFARQFYFGEG